MGMTAPNLHGEPVTEVPATKLFEPGGPGQSAVSWSFPAAARPPRQLRASFWFWLVAVAGLFETTLVVIDATAGEAGSVAEVAVGVSVRLLAFTGLVYLAVRLRQGRNWARIALAVLYGGFGTLSLVIGPVTWLAEGGSLADAMAAAVGSLLFAASRLVHLAAIIAALILMFHPAANAYIRETRRTRANRNRA